jgi:dienelactone hydrolase
MARAVHIAAWLVLLVVLLVFWMEAPSSYNLLALLLLVVSIVAGAGLVLLGVRLLGGISKSMLWACLLYIAVFTIPFFFLGPLFLALAALSGVCVAALGYALSSPTEAPDWKRMTAGVFAAAVLFGFAVALALDGWSVDEDIRWQPMIDEPLQVASPIQSKYSFSQFTYGPGTDDRRPLFGANVQYKTQSVDAGKLLDGWQGLAGWARSGFWNTDADQLPVRGRVWMPDGQGPFPMVLIVHGNHSMEDYSDDGYSYLGEMFARRGLIAVSVDQNMLNSSISDTLSVFDGGLEKENDARGWLLLEHLQQWRTWSQDTTHELFGKADLDKVVLIGHSRGGEAVSEAAVFNRLPAYPDDATLAFAYNFGLRGIIAIAPVDHQYDPRGRATLMRDVNYLVIHGSHDSDVTAFAGSAAFNRLRFDACVDCFKAGFYLIGANHGQFNTGWGATDSPPPFNWLLNRHPLMEGAVQRQVAQSLFSAFIEATVFEDDQSEAFLADPHRAAELLPASVRFLSQYQSAADRRLANFEEDADVASGSVAGVTLTAQGLSQWREAVVDLKWRDTDSASVLLGWSEEGVTDEQVPAYSVIFTDSAPVRAGDVLTFDLAMSESTPGDLEDYESPETIDLTLIVRDRSGHTAQLPLSNRRVLLPQVQPVLYKHALFNSDADSEVVMQRYRFPLMEFVRQAPTLDINQIVEVRFQFDRTPSGSLWLDNIALHNDLPPALN